MKRLRVLSIRIAGLFARRSHDAELREELESLAALQFEEHVAAGVPPDEARRRVHARAGSVTAVQEAVREQRRLAWVEHLARDAAHGLRLLRRNPVFAATAVLSLALGIGANAAIFSIVDHLLLRSLPVAHADRLLLLDGDSWTYPIWEQIRERADQFDGAAAWAADEQVTRAGDIATREPNLFVSGEFFDVLGVSPQLGRAVTMADDRRRGGTHGPVAVLSHAYWERAFGGDPEVLGRTITIGRVPFTIVGVMPRSFFGPEVGRSFSVAIPFGTEPLLRGSGSLLDERRGWWLSVAIRRKPTQTPADVGAVLRQMQPAIREATRTPNPDYLQAPLGVVEASQGQSPLRRRYRDALWVLMGAATVVLLVTCANVANLLLARGNSRRAEMSLRLALGASRRRLVQQLVIESTMVSLLGAGLGLVFAVWVARIIVSQLSTVATPVLDVALDWRLVGFAVAVAGVVTPLFALVPALRATRCAPDEAMKEQGRAVAGDRSQALGQVLVLGQIALSLTLVVLAGLLVGTFTKLATRPLGLDSRRVVVADVTLQPDSVPEAERAVLFERLRQEVSQVPGVDSVALAALAPISGRGWNTAILDVDGADVGGEGRERMAWANGVSDGFFATYGMTLRQGRDFTPADAADAPKVMIVNEAFVRRFVGVGSALGRRVREGLVGQPETYSEGREIVGVVADAAYHRDLRRQVDPTVFIPFTQTEGAAPTFVAISVRARGDGAAALVAPIAARLDRADPRITTRVVAHQSYVQMALAQERLVATVAGLFGGLALLLAVVGLYGVAAYTVSRRRSEIGVRLALGATPQRVLGLVLRRIAVLVVLGIGAGLAMSLWAGKAVRVLLHGLEPSDPGTLAGAAAILTLTAGIAGALPAWRAARTNPAVALRD
ncbi:hypothetical protein TBR22_A51620 [Luteitalea sp. TBR-22]|uniref:ABC transporter permease n=1 Tax=Luteitalea sp. TBR-22 TaxID=2802971 RepID=UPI001AF73412|nr:ABC transporter permease [Luteitalea sp. TBR-22]BCS35927.1 hypothetical protein TBR22_A51620 [Luteitalea sp. TBR-22]